MTAPPSLLEQHLRDLQMALRDPRTGLVKAARWGRVLAGGLLAGRRLLVAGNGGSAAQAQHLTAELVGRYVAERQPLSALALHADTSSITAIGNDYGPDEVFARQVQAHGRPGDVLLALSTSGRSANVLAAARRARSAGLTVWALTGPAPNPLADLADDAICVACRDTATIQEVHLVAVHALCAAVDEEVLRKAAAAKRAAEPAREQAPEPAREQAPEPAREQAPEPAPQRATEPAPARAAAAEGAR